MSISPVRAIDLLRGDKFEDAGQVKVIDSIALVQGVNIQITYRLAGLSNRYVKPQTMTVHKDLLINKI